MAISYLCIVLHSSLWSYLNHQPQGQRHSVGVSSLLPLVRSSFYSPILYISPGRFLSFISVSPTLTKANSRYHFHLPAFVLHRPLPVQKILNLCYACDTPISRYHLQPLVCPSTYVACRAASFLHSILNLDQQSSKQASIEACGT